VSGGAGCLACDLAAGAADLPGGRVHETAHWVVEHCVGPLGVGALVVKPRRHCLGVAELEPAEAAELGPLLARVARCVRELAAADQVYVCLWSHAGFEPGHVHFVLQPAFDAWRAHHPLPGPFVQAAMFSENRRPERAAVEAFCERARRRLARDA
jgi:diadenosine tetraphosphate (Ap4A) HIT family hydrolase